MGKRGYLVALCGLDGTGKTTLFESLKSRCVSEDVEFIPRGPARAERLVERYHPRSGTPLDWVDSRFGNVIATACALDYLAYYEDRILPALSNSALVVMDRHALCILAYARCLRSPEASTDALLASTAFPDNVFLITAAPHLIAQRIESRGKPLNPFEDNACQQRFAEGYASAFKAYHSNVVEIDNSGPAESALEGIMGALERLNPGAFAKARRDE